MIRLHIFLFKMSNKLRLLHRYERKISSITADMKQLGTSTNRCFQGHPVFSAIASYVKLPMQKSARRKLHAGCFPEIDYKYDYRLHDVY